MGRELQQWSARAEREIGGRVGEAVAYSLAASGKRLRPALVLAAYRELGGAGDAAELAAAVEIVHTYSLVHDDLPCMDDDDLRRGRPTTHRAFDVATATEVGIRLVPLSARVLAAGAAKLGLPGASLGAIAAELYGAAGAAGMVGGQVLDLEAEGRALDLEALTRVHAAKTGALITASVVIGGLAAGGHGEQIAALRGFGQEIGLAFQIVDDVLDATATSSELGKTAGKDAAQHKATFAGLLGVQAARRVAAAHMQRAIDLLRGSGVNWSLLPGLAQLIVERRA
ncbi:MAG: polyprenyl synthetase family protein [Gemmatimonadota bacterium]|nr:MAG: polyprenyl synthetase family protein [Gemmatimonadota bacterium]